MLLNSNRVSDFCRDASSVNLTNLFYAMGEGERSGTTEYQLSHSPNTVASRLMEDETNRIIKMDVVAYKDGFSAFKPTSSVTGIWEVCSDNIVLAYDISTTQAHVILNRGLNYITLLVSHTVADISRAYSTSASLSAS